MFTVGLLSLLTGIALGMRFRVLILFPAMALACVIVAALGVVGRDAVSWALFLMLVAVTALQAGYLVGATRAISADARAVPKLRTAA